MTDADRPTIPASESIEEHALTCVKDRTLDSISAAQDVISRYRAEHGHDWLSTAMGRKAA